MTTQFPSATNVYIPDHEASGKLVIDFVSPKSRFQLNKYIQMVDVTKQIGMYLKMGLDEAVRLVNTDLSDFLWPDGADEPDGKDGTNDFEFLQYDTKRFAYAFTLGNLTVDQATWDIVAQHAAIKAHQAMVARTVKAVTALTTSGNYDSTHTSTVAALTTSGYTWANSTSVRQTIKKSLNSAAETILKDTNGVVKPEDLRLVISPTLARAMSESQEIVDLVKQSSPAMQYLQGNGTFSNTESRFGLPSNLYGYEVVIEDTVRNSTRKGATASRGFALGSTVAVLCSRPGGLQGVAGAPSFSTATMFVKENLTVEKKDDTDNRRVKGRVVDDFAVVMTAPVSGFLFTSCQ